VSAQIVNAETGEIISTELALPDVASVELYDDPAQQIVLACERANAWLQSGIAVPIESIVETKAQAAALAAFAIQKQLGHDAELAALEVQRRAERGTGLAIRQGQATGEIRKAGQREDRESVRDLPAPTDFVPQRELSGNNKGIYAMTDGVTDERFDAALQDAKAEGNLSRANVVRKVKGEPKPAGKRHELLNRTRHIDPTRVVRETVYTLDGLAMGLGLLNDDLSGVDLDQAVAEEWATSLTNSLRVLNRLSKSIKEMTHDRS